MQAGRTDGVKQQQRMKVMVDMMRTTKAKRQNGRTQELVGH